MRTYVGPLLDGPHPADVLTSTTPVVELIHDDHGTFSTVMYVWDGRRGGFIFREPRPLRLTFRIRLVSAARRALNRKTRLR